MTTTTDAATHDGAIRAAHDDIVTPPTTVAAHDGRALESRDART
jgi:hypothetical protein